MNYYLVNWSIDCMDEFDCPGFAILTEDEYNEYKSKLEDAFKKCPDPDDHEIYVGTNEWINLSNLEGLLDDPELISKETYDLINKLFGTRFGYDFLEDIDDLESDEDEVNECDENEDNEDE